MSIESRKVREDIANPVEQDPLSEFGCAGLSKLLDAVKEQMFSPLVTKPSRQTEFGRTLPESESATRSNDHKSSFAQSAEPSSPFQAKVDEGVPLFQKLDEAFTSYSIANENYLSQFPKTWDEIRVEARKQPGRLDFENDYMSNLVQFHKAAESLPKEERDRVLGLVPDLQTQHTFLPPSTNDLERIRTELGKSPQLLASFNSMMQAADKICANMSPREKELLVKTQDLSREVDKNFEKYDIERSKNLTFDQIKNSTGSPGETRKAYNPAGDLVVIKYDDRGKPASLSFKHADFPVDVYKAVEGKGFIGKDGQAFNGDVFVNRSGVAGASFRFQNPAEQAVPLPRPTDRPAPASPSERPSRGADRSDQLPTPHPVASATATYFIDETGTRQRISANNNSADESKKYAVEKNSSLATAPTADKTAKLEVSGQSGARQSLSKDQQIKVASEHYESLQAQKKKGLGLEFDHNIFHQKGHESADETRKASKEQMVYFQAQKGVQFERKQNGADQILHIPPTQKHALEHNDRSQLERSKPAAETFHQGPNSGLFKLSCDKRETDQIQKNLERGSKTTLSGTDNQSGLRAGICPDGKSKFMMRNVLDLRQEDGLRLDSRGFPKNLSGRKDIIDKISGPIQNNIGIKGPLIILIAGAKALDGKRGNSGSGRGIEAKGDKTADGGKRPEASSRIARLESLSERTLKLPLEVKNQGIKIAECLIRNPKELFDSKDKAIADAMRQLSKSELILVRMILKTGMKPDFSSFNEKLQAKLLLVFKTLLEQGDTYKAQRDKGLSPAEKVSSPAPGKAGSRPTDFTVPANRALSETRTAEISTKTISTKSSEKDTKPAEKVPSIAEKASESRAFIDNLIGRLHEQGVFESENGIPSLTLEGTKSTRADLKMGNQSEKSEFSEDGDLGNISFDTEQHISPPDILSVSSKSSVEPRDTRLLENDLNRENGSKLNKICHIVKVGESLKDISVRYFSDDLKGPAILHINKHNKQIQYQSFKGKTYVYLPVNTVLIIPDQADLDSFANEKCSYDNINFGSILASEIKDARTKFLNELSTVVLTQSIEVGPDEHESTVDLNLSSNIQNSIIEILASGIKISESECFNCDEQGLRISLRLLHNEQWLGVSHYDIYSIGSSKCQYKKTGESKRSPMSLPKTQLREMAINDFRKNWKSICEDYWREART